MFSRRVFSRSAVRAATADGLATPEKRSTAVMSSTGKSSKHTLVVVDTDSEDEEDGAGGGAGGGAGNTQKKNHTGMSVQPQYNICEHYLDENSLVQVLYQCPNLVAAFDQQLSARLVACHGADDRYKDPEEDSIASENHDFTWIMKKSEVKREVFGLF